MKDLAQIWSRVTGRRYSAVNTTDRELRDLSKNRLKRSDIESKCEANLSECEGLNVKSDDFDFSDQKDAIINRLFERRKKGHKTRQPKCLFLLLLAGFLTIATGCVILFLKPYDFLFHQKVMFSDGGEIFEMWRKPEVDLYVRIYLFNVTNAEAFLSGADGKLKVEEVGPYVYKEALEHEIVQFNDNGTLTARPKHPLTWMPELSEGRSENDTLYLPHIALLSIANVVSQNFFYRFALNRLIGASDIQPLVKMTAGEFMMGYESNLMTLGNTFMPGWLPFDKLGLIDRMYDFTGDYETIFTGQSDIRDSGLIDTYRGSTDLPQWEGKHCSNVQYASDGTKFKGGVQMNESMLFYRKSLCRAAPLVPRKQGVKSGLAGHMFTFPDNMLDNGKYNEENKCFCREGKCLPAGLIDVTDCYYGFPISLSYPHFYQGDEVLFSKVEGLKPNKEQHETHFWIEPVSGLPLDVSSKFQINMALGDISSVKNCDKFSEMYLPLLWFDIRMYALPQHLETRFRFYLNILPVVEQAGMYLAFIFGILIILFTVYRLTFNIMFKTFDQDKKKKRNNIIIGTDLWMERDKTRRNDKDGIYAPCEIPLNGDTTESDEAFDNDKPNVGFIKTHSERIKELSVRLGDRVYDSVGSVKDKVKGEFVHVKKIFKDNEERKNSLIVAGDEANTNEAYKSDSGEDEHIDYRNKYTAVVQTDSDDDCRYLEVLDDGSGFDNPVLVENNRFNHLDELDSSRNDNDLFLHISD